MNYSLPNAYGEDYWIENLKNGLYTRLQSVWGVTDQTYNAFGRAYRNNTDDGYIPEFYNPATKTYTGGSGKSAGGLFYQNTLAAMSFFGVTDPVNVENGVNKLKVLLMFFVNLNSITPGGITNAQGQRLDDVCISDVQNYIQSNGSNFEVKAVYKDIDKVLERYSGTLKRRALKDDMHPKFCFRIDLELRYNPLLNKPFIIS